MMLAHVDKMDPYERQLLLVFKQAADNSPFLDNTQKTAVERLLQEVVDVWTGQCKEGAK